VIKKVFDVIVEETRTYVVKEGFETMKEAEAFGREWEHQTWGRWAVRERRVVKEAKPRRKKRAS